MLSDVAFHLAGERLSVHVVTSRQRYDNAAANLPAREIVSGVRVSRVWSSQFDRHMSIEAAISVILAHSCNRECGRDAQMKSSKRSIRHWSYRYIVDRVELMRYERKHPDAPWLTSAMVEVLDRWLKPVDCGLEWGSGRSTVWFARRTARLTSVEHDPDWAERVTDILRHARLEGRVDYRLAPDGASERQDSNYVQVVQSIETGTLDYCLVDGVARDHCALVCLDRLKPGGVVIIDNANWYIPQRTKSRAPNSRGLEDGFASDVWAEFWKRVREWRSVWTTNGVTDTAFWVKPC
jgi:hypothetical protein